MIAEMWRQILEWSDCHGSPLVLLDLLHDSQVNHASLPLGG